MLCNLRRLNNCLLIVESISKRGHPDEPDTGKSVSYRLIK